MGLIVPFFLVEEALHGYLNELTVVSMVFLSYSMTFEEASDMFAMYSISPQLTCQCDEFHMCQQCYEDEKNESELNGLENKTFEGD